MRLYDPVPWLFGDSTVVISFHDFRALQCTQQQGLHWSKSFMELGPKKKSLVSLVLADSVYESLFRAPDGTWTEWSCLGVNQWGPFPVGTSFREGCEGTHSKGPRAAAAAAFSEPLQLGLAGSSQLWITHLIAAKTRASCWVLAYHPHSPFCFNSEKAIIVHWGQHWNDKNQGHCSGETRPFVSFW